MAGSWRTFGNGINVHVAHTAHRFISYTVFVCLDFILFCSTFAFTQPNQWSEEEMVGFFSVHCCCLVEPFNTHTHLPIKRSIVLERNTYYRTMNKIGPLILFSIFFAISVHHSRNGPASWLAVLCIAYVRCMMPLPLSDSNYPCHCQYYYEI